MAERVAVSFIVPVYNAAAYLPQCVQSLLAQTCPDFEVILVDDGSTDGCGALCDEYAAKDARIHALHQANAGVSAARNNGISAARGDWLCFADADDWVAPDYVGLVAQHGAAGRELLLFNHADAFAHKTVAHQTPGDVRILDAAALTEARHCVLNRYHHGTPDFRTVHLTGPWAKAYRRETVLRAGLRFPVGITSGEDAYFNFLYLQAVRCAVLVPRIVYYYRHAGASVTQRYSPALAENFRRVDALYRQYFAASPAAESEFSDDYTLFLTSCCLFIALRDCCHPGNPQPYRVRRGAFIRLVSQTVFGAALTRAKLSEFSSQKKIICLLVKHRAFFVLNLLTRLAGIS